MNWKEVPHLFTAGKFKVKAMLLSMPVGEVECVIHGYSNGKYRLQFSGIFEWINVRDCTLIARPISDMTDEEVRQIMEMSCEEFGVNEVRDEMIRDANMGILLFYQAKRLLSIGVYPFDQSHFETGEVIEAT